MNNVVKFPIFKCRVCGGRINRMFDERIEQSVWYHFDGTPADSHLAEFGGDGWEDKS